MSVDNVSGIVGGEYIISNQEDELQFLIRPTEGYSPVPGKAWMKKMVWSAKIEENKNEYQITSQWTRK